MDKKCGANCKAGPCQKPALKNGRCKNHGGMCTGPREFRGNQNARKHGVYGKFLTAEEKAQYTELSIGSVDHELRLMRIRMARALEAEAKAAGEPELDEVVENDGGGVQIPTQTRKRLVRDYNKIIDRLALRIESLERTRKLLDAGDGDNDGIVGFETMPYDD